MSEVSDNKEDKDNLRPDIGTIGVLVGLRILVHGVVVVVVAGGDHQVADLTALPAGEREDGPGGLAVLGPAPAIRGPVVRV